MLTIKRPRWIKGAVLIAALAAALMPSQVASAGAHHGKPTGPKPTIVLVHGAWADASSFAPVTTRLQRDGYTVLAEANPLRGLSSDSAYLTAFLQQRTTGPVILVGHSYGGAVITNAATSDPDVKGLVYVDAFAPAQGESVLALTSSAGGPDPSTVFDAVAYPGAPAGDYDLYFKQSIFPAVFANGLPAAQAQQLSVSQRPVTLSAFSEPSGPPAWKSLPSWYVLGTKDNVISPALQRSMATRAHSHITKVPAGHLSMLSHPDIVTRVIEKAGCSTK